MTTAKQDKPTRRLAAGRARRWLRRGLKVGVVAAAVGWLAQSVLLPWLVRDKVTEALAGLGFADSRFEVRSASFWGTRLADLTAAGGDLRVGTLDVSYRPLSAASGELDVIRIGGAEIRLTIRDGRTNLGLPASSDRPSTNTAPTADATLPFRRLEVAASSLRVDWDGREFWLPVSGAVENRGNGAAKLKLDSFAFGSPLTIAGTVDVQRGTSRVTADAGQVDLATLLASVPSTLGPLPVRAGGRAAVRVVHDRSAGGAATTTAAFEPDGAWLTADAGGHAVAIEGLSLCSEVVLDDAFQVTALSGRGTVGAMRVGGEEVRDVALAFGSDGPAVRFESSARGETWRVEQLSGTVTGLLGARPPSEVRLGAELAGAARLPPAAERKLNAAGVDAAGLGEARVQIEATGTARRRADGGWRWEATVPKLQLTLAPGDLAGPGGAKLRGLTGVLNLGGKFAPEGGNVFLIDDSWIAFRSLDSGPGGDGDASHVGKTRVALAADPRQPLARANFGPQGVRLRGTMKANSVGATALNTTGMDASLGQLRVSATFVAEPGKPSSANVELGVADASVNQTASGLALAGISARVPVAFNQEKPQPPGAFEVASVSLGTENLEPIRGTLGVSDGRATFTAKWAALPEAVLNVKGWLASLDDGPAGEITASVPSFRLDDADALADRFSGLDGWDVTGTFEAGAKLLVAQGRLVPRATLTVTGANARSTEAGVDVKGLSGALAADTFAPFGTPGGQRLSVAGLAFGDVKMTDASLAFRVEAGALVVEQAEADWLGGRVSARGARFDPAKPRFETTLYAEQLSLKEILAFAAEGRATGEGVMSGKLPVAVDWPRVQLGQGYLRSQSPAGELQVLDTQLLADTMERSDPRFTSDPDLAEVKNRVVRALADFEYDALTFNFEEESGGLVRINTHGKGRAGERPQELDLTLNVRGANDLLNHYLQAKTTWDELSN